MNRSKKRKRLTKESAIRTCYWLNRVLADLGAQRYVDIEPHDGQHQVVIHDPTKCWDDNYAPDVYAVRLPLHIAIPFAGLAAVQIIDDEIHADTDNPIKQAAITVKAKINSP